MLSAARVQPRSIAAIPYGDPIAQELLGDQAGDSSLGVFVAPSAERRGLGFAFSIPAILKAVPTVVGFIRQVSGGGSATSDPIAAVWQAVPPSAINAREGTGGYWYDLATGSELSHEEAAERQQNLVAAMIHAHVGPQGWWVDDTTGETLDHDAVWARYQTLGGTGTILTGPQAHGAGAGGGAGGGAGAPVGAATAGLSTQTMLIIGAVGLGLLLVSKKRRA